MKKILSALVVAASTLAVVGVASASAANADTDDLRITLVGYNARGNDTWFNRNKEFVDIKNTGSGNADLNGFVLADRWGRTHSDSVCNRYEVHDVTLAEGETLRIYTGRGTGNTTPSNGYFYRYMDHGSGDTKDCGYNGHYINNLGDKLWFYKGGVSVSMAFDFEAGYTVR